MLGPPGRHYFICESGVSELPQEQENHFVHRVSWLRAAVLGSNDGMVSTASLIVGAAAATPNRNARYSRNRQKPS